MKKIRQWFTTNREVTKQPTKKKFWCGGCDASLIGVSGKCKVCGYQYKNLKFKKIGPLE